MTDKITDLERAVVDAAMEYVKIYPGRTFDLAQACRALAAARAVLEPVPGEDEAFMLVFPDSLGLGNQSSDLARRFRAALRVAIKADREARDG